MREFIERAQGGDLEAFGQLVEQFQDAVYGTAYALLGDFHDAQDLAQESFIRVWQNLKGLRDPGKFPGWLYQITRNCCLDFLRRKEAGAVPLSQAEVPASDVPTAPEKLEKAEMQEAVLDAIKALSEPNRLATTLFYIDGYSVEEVAEFLAVPSGTVKRRLYDSRKKLRERMIAMVEDELKGSRPGPEFKEKVMRVVSRVEVRPEKSSHDQGRVILVADDGRCLPIFIGKNEEAAIHRAVTGQKPPRPLTHELFLSVLQSYGITGKEARITRLGSADHHGTFFGELVLERGGEERVLDSRPSDAVALAMMTGAKVTVADSVMEKGGAKMVRTDAELEKLWESLAGPEEFNRNLIELCRSLQSLTDDALAQIVHKTGPTTVATALAAVSERIVEERPGAKYIATTITPTIKPEGRASLPEEVVRALESVFEKLDQASVKVEASCLPPRVMRDAVVAAREAIRDAIGEASC